ncbi:hypothetical protein MXB_3610, partial [Myxobolus squamalis]
IEIIVKRLLTSIKINDDDNISTFNYEHQANKPIDELTIPPFDSELYVRLYLNEDVKLQQLHQLALIKFTSPLFE